MLRSSLCYYSKACIFVEGFIEVATETNAAPNNANKMVIFKNCVPLTNFMGRINNAQVAEASNINVLMPMYNLVEYNDIQSKHLQSYGNFIKMYRLLIMIMKLLI